MGLKTKNLKQILRDLVENTVTRTSKITDFSPGTVIRTLYESIALSLEQFYFHVKESIFWAIENSVLDAFGFRKREATRASGIVTLTFQRPLLDELHIPKGTMFSTSNIGTERPLYYETIEPITIPQGVSSYDVTVYCTKPGSEGNIPSHAIQVMINPISVISRVENPDAFTNGREPETKGERKQRFKEYIDTLAKGTLSAIEYGVKEVEGVVGVRVEEDIGLIKVYAHDSSGNLPDELRSKIDENLINYRPAGIPVQILATSKIQVDIHVKIQVTKAFDNSLFEQQLKNGIESFINEFPVGRAFLLADLVQYIMNYDDIAILNCSVISPTEDVMVSNHQLFRANNITVEVYS